MPELLLLSEVAVDISAVVLAEVEAEPWAVPPPQSTEDEAAEVEPKFRPVVGWNTLPLAAVGSDWEQLHSRIEWAATRTAARFVERRAPPLVAYSKTVPEIIQCDSLIS